MIKRFVFMCIGLAFLAGPVFAAPNPELEESDGQSYPIVHYDKNGKLGKFLFASSEDGGQKVYLSWSRKWEGEGLWGYDVHLNVSTKGTVLKNDLILGCTKGIETVALPEYPYWNPTNERRININNTRDSDVRVWRAVCLDLEGRTIY